MKSNLRQALKVFHELPRAGQDALLRDLHRASMANKLLIENRLCEAVDFSELVSQMERETIGKVYRRRLVDGRKVAAIITAAKNAKADYRVLMELEQLAYRGFIEFLHEYGGGPDSYENMGPAHVAAYLKLVRDNMDPIEAEQEYRQVWSYLNKKDNMVQDYNFEAFEEATGLNWR